MQKILISGVNGAMGQVLSSCISQAQDMKVVCGVDKFTETPNSFPVFQNIFEYSGNVDVIIDFSRPDALHAVLSYAVNKKCAVVIATTGLSSEQLADVRAYSKEIPIFMSANMSLGVNLQMDLIRRAAEFLGSTYDVEILEAHHNKKVDAPSGTAYMLADALNAVSLNPLEYVYDRHSKNHKRNPHELGIHSIRGGTIAGEHSVYFIGMDEVLEVNHRALSKQVFAQGAMRAASYIAKKSVGLYSMRDIITEQNAITNVYTDEKQATISLVNLHEDPKLISDLFESLADANVIIDMISQTAPQKYLHNLSFSLDVSKLSAAHAVIRNFSQILEENVLTDTAVTKITIEGLGMEYQSGVAAKVFRALADFDINIKLITTSETKIALCISKADQSKAVTAMEKLFSK